MLQANIGLEPWSVLQQGIHLTIGVSFGTAVILVNGIIILIDILLGEKIGFGTILSALLSGVFIDLISALNCVPKQSSTIFGILYMMVGLELLAFGTYLYMKVALGCGARDALMVAFSRRTGISVGICRIVLELIAVLVGYLMGGRVGIGTIMGAFGIGALIELNFRLFRLDVVDIQHESVIDTWKNLICSLNTSKTA